jgi:D-amino-acid oxidase
VARVIVVGGGVSGLSSAISLREAGHDVTVVSKDYLRGTCSWVATAIWHLFWVNIDDRVERWGAGTLKELLRLAGDPRTGITLISGLECVRQNTKQEAELRSGGTTALWQKVVPSYSPLSRQDLIGLLPAGYPIETLVGGYKIGVPIADMSIYLPYLIERLTMLGVELKKDVVASLSDLRSRHPSDILVNCTGLGARDLTGDRELQGVKGQIVRVGGVAVNEYIADDSSPVGMTYVLPRRHDIILGGTEDVDVENDDVELKTGDEILKRCIALVPDLTRATIHEHMAGVRPFRKTGIRVELELLDEGPVIHNYGHGGSGFSLSWGCASDVVGLVESACDEPSRERIQGTVQHP